MRTGNATTTLRALVQRKPGVRNKPRHDPRSGKPPPKPAAEVIPAALRAEATLWLARVYSRHKRYAEAVKILAEGARTYATTPSFAAMLFAISSSDAR